MFANVERVRERERDWCRHVKVNMASADRQVERERDVCVCVFFLNFVSLFYFTLGTRLRISKFCVDLCKKKSDRTRCLAVSILEYNINWNSKRFGFLKEKRNSVVIHR